MGVACNVLLFLTLPVSAQVQFRHTWDESTQSWSPNLQSYPTNWATALIVNDNDTGSVTNHVRGNWVEKWGTGTLELRGQNSFTGFYANQGDVRIDGTGNSLAVNGNLAVSGTDGANVSVTNGGQLLYCTQLSIGSSYGETGTLTVDGIGSRLEFMSAPVWNGTFNLTDGATAYGTGYLQLMAERSLGHIAQANISGAGTILEMRNGLQIGTFAGGGVDDTGGLNISGGAKVAVGNYSNVRVGQNGQIVVNGKNSSLESAASIVVGNAYAKFLPGEFGELRLEDGAFASAANGIQILDNGTMYASGATVLGNLTVDGLLTLAYSSITESFGLFVDGGVSITGGMITCDFSAFDGWNTWDTSVRGDTEYLTLDMVSYTVNEMSFSLCEFNLIGIEAGMDAGWEYRVTEQRPSFMGHPGTWSLVFTRPYVEQPPVTGTPEPATLLTLGLGAIGAGFVVRRRK